MIMLNADRQLAGRGISQKGPSAERRRAQHRSEGALHGWGAGGHGLESNRETFVKNRARWIRLEWLLQGVEAGGRRVRALLAPIPAPRSVRVVVADQRGQTMAEYSLVLGFIALVAVAAYMLLGPQVYSAVDGMVQAFP
jgi:Flp pilus assembly pilin Flp